MLRCLGQRQLDKERCPEAAALCSKARPFAPCRASGVQRKVARPANGSPFGGAGAKRLRGQGRYQTALHSDSIALTKRQLIAAWRLPGAGLALSVCCADTSPKGRGFRPRAGAKSPLSEIAAPRGAGYLAKWYIFIVVRSKIVLRHRGGLTQAGELTTSPNTGTSPTWRTGKI